MSRRNRTTGQLCILHRYNLTNDSAPICFLLLHLSFGPRPGYYDRLAVLAVVIALSCPALLPAYLAHTPAANSSPSLVALGNLVCANSYCHHAGATHAHRTATGDYRRGKIENTHDT